MKRKLFIIGIAFILLSQPLAVFAVDEIAPVTSHSVIAGTTHNSAGLASSAVSGAAGGLLGCAAGGLLGSVGNIISLTVPVSDPTNNTKECVLDGLAYALAEGMLSSLIRSTTDWVNNGFEGGPSYVTNLNQFLGEVADNTSLDFILGSELDYLCSPFELEIRISLALQRQPFRETIRCSLGDVVDNVDRFFSGDFSQGGWPAWFRVHTNLQNNPYGAYYLASAELSARITGRQNEERTLLTLGDGFLSQRRCKDTGGNNYRATDDNFIVSADTETGATEGIVVTENKAVACAEYEIVTPGQTISESLNKALGLPADRLALADEFNELIGALLAQLTQQMFSSIDGLKGLSSKTSSSAITKVNADGSRETGSYLDALVAQSEGGALEAGEAALVYDIDAAVALEEQAQDALRQLIENLESCDLSITGPTAASSTAATTVSSQVAAYQQELAQSTQTMQRLLSVRAQIRAAETVEALNAAAAAYDAILSSGVMHSYADVSLLTQELSLQQVAALGSQTAQGASVCPLTN